MRKPRPFTLFFLKLLLIYVALVVPWPGLDRPYLACFRAVGNRLFGSFGSGGEVQFVTEFPFKTKQPTLSREKWPVKYVLRNKINSKAFAGQYLARHGYLTLALVIALILATPVPWSRRWKALLLGFFLINGFVAFRVFIALLNEFTQGSIALFTPSPFWKKALQLAFEIMTRSPEFTFIVPVFVWVLVTLRRRDFDRWLNPEAASKKSRSGK